MFVIQFTTPQGAAEYYPEGFGFTAHAHATNIDNAARFPTKERASGALAAYVNPPAFWESERRHRELMLEKFRGWKFNVLEA